MVVRFFQKLFKLLVIITLLYLIYYIGINTLLPYIKSLGDKNFSSILTGSITLIVGIGAVIISQNKIKKRELAEAHREKKIELYNRYNDKIFELFAGANKNVTGKAPSEQNLIDFMLEFKRDLMFRASPQVIKAVIKFENKSNKPNSESSVLRYVDDIYLAMREDIGLNNFGLSNLEMIKIFLKDKSEVWSVT